MKRILIIIMLLVPLLALAEGRDDFGRAQWIGATADADDSLADRSVILSKEIDCPWSHISNAKVYICGLGCYELYIDGKKVNPQVVLSPAWSDYNKTVFYNIIDVTPFITKGKHTIEVWLGNGFYHERGLRYHKLTANYGPLTLLFNLELTRSAIDKNKSRNKTLSFVSDTSWQWRRSPITYNSIYGGEDYDARLESKVQPTDTHAVVQKAPKGVLRQQLCEPVAIMEHFNAVRKLYDKTDSTGSRTMVFDMGQNAAGFPEIKVKGKRGQQVCLTVGESLRKDGLVSQKQTGKPHYYIYTLKGDSVEYWHPRFSYYSLRYIEASPGPSKGGEFEDTSAMELPEIVGIKSDFISNRGASFVTHGTFECSNPLFNATYRIIDNAIKSNWMSIWTDCPAREKLGWLEQDWLNGEGLLTNYDCRKMLEQEMIVISDAQHDDGSMPEIAPEYIHFEGSWAPPFQESPEWGGALIALPYLYKEFYGDDKLIKKYMPQMKKYVDYFATRDSAYILKMGLGDWYDYGPWRAGFSRNTPLALVSTAHYYLWAKLTNNNALADSIKHAFIRTFKPSSQAGLAIAIDLGLCNDEHPLLDSLIADIHRHGDRLTTGDIGTRYLFRVLINYGQEDLLYKMLNHYDAPGYGAQIAKDMTTLTEQWDPDRGASRNHFMLGHINNHLVPDIGGIHIRNNRAFISPLPMGDLTWCKASAVVHGKRVKTYWKINDGVFDLTVSAPDEQIITIEYEKINNMCAKRHLRLHYQFVRAE